jgi:hypothetical protein
MESPVAKIEVKLVRATATQDEMAPHWEAVIDYGAFEAVVPLPGRMLPGDDWAEQRRESLEAMERLAKALLRFVDRTRKEWSSD